MELKADNPLSLLDRGNLTPILRAYFQFNHLKHLYRQGWLRRGVPRERCESVAEHSLGVALLACWLADSFYPQLDQDKLVLMALVHDFGEVYAGDIIPQDDLSPAEKYQLELDSVQRVFSCLPGGERYISLWLEFESGETPEARLLRQVDRLEMGFQSAVYHTQGFPGMGEFFDSAASALSDPQLQSLLDEIRTF